MNTTQILQRVRESAFLEDNAIDWTDTAILRVLNDTLKQRFGRGIVAARQGYWLKNEIRLITAGTDAYRIPQRAVAGSLHRVQIAYDSGLQFIDLQEIDEKQAQNYEGPTTQTGTVTRFVMRGDDIVLMPAPDSTNYALRIFYYLRASRVIPTQAAATTGQITGVNPAARTITLASNASIILNYAEDGTSSALASGNRIDVITTTGWHDVKLISEPVTFSTNVLTCTGTGDMSTIAVGDYVRYEDESEYPQLPDDFHRCLADLTAQKILTVRRMVNPDLVSLIETDLASFGDLLKPRVQTSGKVICAPTNIYRGSRRGFWPVKYP